MSTRAAPPPSEALAAASRAAWNADPELQAEFPTMGAYVAFKNAEARGRVRMLAPGLAAARGSAPSGRPSAPSVVAPSAAAPAAPASPSPVAAPPSPPAAAADPAEPTTYADVERAPFAEAMQSVWDRSTDLRQTFADFPAFLNARKRGETRRIARELFERSKSK